MAGSPSTTRYIIMIIIIIIIITFYHKGHEAAKDCKPYMTDLQIRVQNVSIFM